jgi:peptide chain release factor 2
MKHRIEELSKQIGTGDFWKDPKSARKATQEKSSLEKEVQRWLHLSQRFDNLTAAMELLLEQEDPSLHIEIKDSLAELTDQLGRIEQEKLFTGEKDINHAIVSIHPGAGGTESQDWAQMLMRMYVRWAEKSRYQVKLLDLQPGEEAGIKGATFSVSGEYAYGYLRAEAGVHRLVRISPFDANKRRHTSFASVFVYPEIEDDIEVQIDDKELRVDTYRASSAGGQHVNKTSSAVRITHLPTGTVVQCQNERSQHQNRAVAMKVLRAKLYEMERQKSDEELSRLTGEKKEIGWGSQIRSYVFQPYQMVKDHRTNLEIGNVQAVMDGGINPFIEAYLLKGMKRAPAKKGRAQV